MRVPSDLALSEKGRGEAGGRDIRGEVRGIEIGGRGIDVERRGEMSAPFRPKGIHK
jgi:hypothetical protein